MKSKSNKNQRRKLSKQLTHLLESNEIAYKDTTHGHTVQDDQELSAHSPSCRLREGMPIQGIEPIQGIGNCMPIQEIGHCMLIQEIEHCLHETN
jgi:hypothetical protein